MARFQRIRYSVTQLLEHAREKTRKLSPGERKIIIQHLDETERRPQKLSQLADLLGVSRMQVSRDRLDLIQKAGDALSAVNASQVVAEYLKDLDRQIANIEDVLAEADADGVPDATGAVKVSCLVRGSIPHLQYERLLSDLRERRIAKLQEIGVVPKELGRLNVREEVWKAVVDGETGVVTNSSLEAGESAEQLGGETGS